MRQGLKVRKDQLARQVPRVRPVQQERRGSKARQAHKVFRALPVRKGLRGHKDLRAQRHGVG